MREDIRSKLTLAVARSGLARGVVDAWIKDRPLPTSIEIDIRDEFGNVVGVTPMELLSIMASGRSCDAVAWMAAFEDWAASIPRTIAVDVGAHIGRTAMFLASRFETVIALEPVSENRERLVDNLRKNDVKNVVVVPYAVGARNGEGVIRILESSGHHSMAEVRTSRLLERRKVSVRTLDDLTAELGVTSIDLLKLDVEGTEADVLAGADSLLTSQGIASLVFEHSRSILENLGRDLLEVPGILQRSGFDVLDVSGAELTDAMLRAEHVDLVAVRGR